LTPFNPPYSGSTRSSQARRAIGNLDRSIE
jgi:hypothetical protein